jgi:hypothetical protein
MPDYQKSKIYKITSGDLTYIGSTTQETLAQRLSGHVSGYKQWKKGNRDKVTSFQLIETGIYEIILIELFPCGSKDELYARERFHIENTTCVNKVIPGQTIKEWTLINATKLREYKQDNIEDINEYQKTYRETNREKARLYAKEYNKKKKQLTQIV